MPSKRDVDLFVQPRGLASLGPFLLGLWPHAVPYANASRPCSVVAALLDQQLN